MFFCGGGGRERFLLDVADGLNFRSPAAPPYEPSFLYWRLSNRRAPITNVLQDFFDSYERGGFPAVVYYRAPSVQEYTRLVVDLDHFNIVKESDFLVGWHNSNNSALLPSASGTRYYTTGQYPRCASTIDFAVFDATADGNTRFLGSYEFRRSDWTRETDGNGASSARYYIGAPQPTDDGIIVSAFAIANDQTTGESCIQRCGFLKLETDPVSGGGLFENAMQVIATKSALAGRRQYGRLIRLMDLECDSSDPVLGDLDELYLLYYAEREDAALAYRYDDSSSSDAATLIAIHTDNGKIEKLCRLERITTMFLVDYERGILFFISRGKP